jgi:uncharacterized damage-inducible protein DinB
MHKAIEDYIDRLKGQQQAAAAALEGLPAEALDWVPGSDMSALGVLAAHLAGTTRYWIVDVVGQQEIQRDRDAEFATRGMDAAALVAGMDAAMVEALAVVGALSADDLGAMRRSRRHDEDYSVMWSLLHVLEHWGEHVGHMQLTRQLWEQGIGR